MISSPLVTNYRNALIGRCFVNSQFLQGLVILPVFHSLHCNLIGCCRLCQCLSRFVQRRASRLRPPELSLQRSMIHQGRISNLCPPLSSYLVSNSARASTVLLGRLFSDHCLGYAETCLSLLIQRLPGCIISRLCACTRVPIEKITLWVDLFYHALCSGLETVAAPTENRNKDA